MNLPLHSTMFLLIRLQDCRHRHESDYFTFHNVSINTPIDGMFCKQFTAFTFHNVSINTQSWLQGFGYKENFTFHNVSINTESPDGQQVSDILYIPQCFY